MKNTKKNRVVVTGLGVISSIGIGWPEFWKNLIAGKSGISRIESFDTSRYECHLGGEVKGFKPEDFIAKAALPSMGRASQLAIAAVKLAIKDGGITIRDAQKFKAGFCIGTTMGESRVIETIVSRQICSEKLSLDTKLAFAYPASAIVLNVMKYFKFTGESLLFANACAAGNYAVGHAFDVIKSGRSDYMFAGGTDAISRIAFTGFQRLFAMSKEKCQPFDKHRQGMMLGEGSGVLLLESLEQATKRGAKIYAEVLGYGMSCDARHMTGARVDGVAKAIEKALVNSGISARQVDYVSAHGTGTPENDKIECAAFKKIFGERLREVPISSIKSSLGHTMGAASALEAISCCLALKDGILPSTINFNEPDPECVIDCVPNVSRRAEINIVLNNSQAFGGNNAALLLKRNVGFNEE